MSEQPEEPNSRDWGTEGYQGHLNKNCVTIAEVLKNNGYYINGEKGMIDELFLFKGKLNKDKIIKIMNNKTGIPLEVNTLNINNGNINESNIIFNGDS